MSHRRGTCSSPDRKPRRTSLRDRLRLCDTRHIFRQTDSYPKPALVNSQAPALVDRVPPKSPESKAAQIFHSHVSSETERGSGYPERTQPGEQLRPGPAVSGGSPLVPERFHAAGSLCHECFFANPAQCHFDGRTNIRRREYIRVCPFQRDCSPTPWDPESCLVR